MATTTFATPNVIINLRKPWIICRKINRENAGLSVVCWGRGQTYELLQIKAAMNFVTFHFTTGPVASCKLLTSVILTTTALKQMNKPSLQKKKRVTITTWHHLVTPNKWQLFFLENIWWHSLISTTSADARGVHADYRGDSAVNPVWSHSYHVDLPNEVLQEHLPGICGMTHILEALRGVSACLLQQNLLASWMLKAQKTLEHQLISQSAGCSLNSSIKQQEELLGIRCRHII